MNLTEKIDTLSQLIRAKASAAVAFSGGVDSSFLAKMLVDHLGDRSLALTIDSVFVPRDEIEHARQFSRQIGIRHSIIPFEQLPEEILVNDRMRCYQCKKTLFSRLRDAAESEAIETLFDGSNCDDLSDYRPGMKALQELGVESPLIECGFSKRDIRDASRQMGLSTWDHPSMACLASRIPYDTKISKQALKMVEQAESVLKAMGLKQLRVRIHHESARIEVPPEDRSWFFDTDRMDRISTEFKSIGFKFVSLDLEGYRMGKLNDSSQP